MSNAATYSPEDNKLRLYVGRVPRDEYEKLRADGWTSTPRQSCDFAAAWTPSRRDACLGYADLIEDEDQGPEDRAADRAERFGEYRDKRTEEAVGHADAFGAGPQAHGCQSEARAQRPARRHDRIAGRARDSWGKAEYWQRRTAGVIRHALHKSTPGVRMGRIKTLEAELRKARLEIEEAGKNWRNWRRIRDMADPETRAKTLLSYVGNSHQRAEYLHPRAETHPNRWRKENKTSIYSLMTDDADPVSADECLALYFSNHGEPAIETDWTRHLVLRLGYENQMLEAQGGRLASVEIEPGGKIGGKLVVKVNKSNVTGRVVSAHLKGSKVSGWAYRTKNVPGTDYALHQFDTERMPMSAYTPPTEETRAELEALKAEKKSKAPEKAPCPLINPTDADAERLQAIWNAAAKEPSAVRKLAQAEYSAASGGAYSTCETAIVSEFGTERRVGYYGGMAEDERCSVFKVRKAPSSGMNSADRVVIITDKPQKPLPFGEIAKARAGQPTTETMRPRLDEIQKALASAWLADENRPLLEDAAYVGWVSIRSLSQIYWTDAGKAEYDAATVNA
jgi:hypothetical protein